ncbi:MAG TPA: hypothetical protein VJW20_16925 [Candidatus Angelobacter sp.]|nr:hypothetical protein [Candidatus Angelobacter sp.]
MATPAQPPQESQTKPINLTSLSPLADVLSKGIAGIVLTVYSSGFLIVSLHQAKYGFTEANPFRPRILAAGAWFFLLSGIPVVIVTSYRARHTQMNWKAVANFLYLFYLGCAGLSWPAVMFFNLTGSKPFKTWWLIVGVLGILVLFVVRESKRIPDYVSAISSIAIVLVFITSAMSPIVVANDFGQTSITIWFFGIGVASLLFAGRMPMHLGDNYWAQSLFFVLTLLFLFASYYYPNMKASWGGGSPVPVTLYFTKDSLLKPNQSVSARLVDESDAGFYIVGQDETKAVFVPRNAVSLVYFSDKVTDSKLLK